MFPPAIPGHPLDPVEPTKHASMFPTTHGQNPLLVTPRGRVNAHNPPVVSCRQPGWQHNDLPPPAPLQVPITRNGPPYKAPWHLAGVAPVSGVTCILRLQPHVMSPVCNSTLHSSPVHSRTFSSRISVVFIPCYTSTYLVWVQLCTHSVAFDTWNLQIPYYITLSRALGASFQTSQLNLTRRG